MTCVLETDAGHLSVVSFKNNILYVLLIVKAKVWNVENNKTKSCSRYKLLRQKLQ